MRCTVCGGTAFTQGRVLWRELVDEWQLSPAEVEYTDRQQGECCSSCGCNLRSIALANAIRGFLTTKGTLREAAVTTVGRELRVLEINEAGGLTSTLRTFGGYVFGAYPELDMHAIPYEDATFDLVVHSDTLEHVPNPVHALSECLRVLKPSGALCYTVPVIVGRMTRDRTGLPKSFHGSPGLTPDDYAVQTEYGADFWTAPIEAGFDTVTIHSVEFPAATALLARSCG